ncbi:MAG: M56 family metallopeptidase, partial [Chloroflexi bacterium]|nr:M56 family metallopeptidase [Chloroflexota bacterium]
GQFPKLDAALADLKARGKSTPPIFLTNQREPVACTVGTFKPVLLLSPSLIAAMDERELKGVLAHEMAHLQKGDNWKSWILLVLRSFMFFNPVALIVFRKLTQENEKVCDDLAVRATREPLALASGVLKVFRSGVDDPDLSSGVKGKLLSWGESLDHRARAQATEERVARLLQTTDFKAVAWEEIRIGLVVISMFVLLFLVM